MQPEKQAGFTQLRISLSQVNEMAHQAEALGIDQLLCFAAP